MFNLNPILKKRVNAFTLDMFIIVAANYFFMAAFSDFLKVMFFHFPIQTQLLLIQKFTYVHSVSLLSLTFAYFSIFYYATNGQTMGKMIMGLRVKSTHSEMTISESMLRSISYVTCAFLGSFLFATSFIRKDMKSVADLISGTNVDLDIKTETFQTTEFQLTLIDCQNDTEEDTPKSEELEYFEQNKSA
jgi:uncharacterized RDD family membrane protein YckC